MHFRQDEDAARRATIRCHRDYIMVSRGELLLYCGRSNIAVATMTYLATRPQYQRVVGGFSDR